MEQDWEEDTEQQLINEDSEGRFGGSCLWAFVALIITGCVWGILTIRTGVKLHHQFLTEQQPKVLLYNWDYISTVILKSAGVGFVHTLIGYLGFVIVVGMLAFAVAPIIKEWGTSAPSGPRELK